MSKQFISVVRVATKVQEKLLGVGIIDTPIQSFTLRHGFDDKIAPPHQYKGTSLIRKLPFPQDPDKTLNMGLP